MIRIIKALQASKKELEEKLKEVEAEDEDVKLLKTFPEIDYITAATLLSEIGNIERFEKGRMPVIILWGEPCDVAKRDSRG